MRVTLAASCFALTLGLGAAASAEVLRVPSQYPSIQSAINAAATGAVQDGSLIEVAPGTYTESLLIDSTARSFTVRGPGGAGATTVRRATSGVAVLRVLRTTGVIRFEGLTFRDGIGSTGNGGGMTLHDSSPIISDCIFDSNTAPQGGGALLIHSSPVFQRTIFRNNVATDTGGGLTLGVGSRAIFIDSQIIANRSGTSAPTGGGGGVHLHDSSAVFRGSVISGNRGAFAGGGIMQLGIFGSSSGPSLLVLEDSYVENNVAQRFAQTSAYQPTGGGGVHIEDNAVAYIVRTRIRANIADIAGGLSSHRARFEVQSSSIEGNQSVDPLGVGGFGGGIGAFSNNLPGSPLQQAAAVVLRDSVVANNVAQIGGAIAISGDHSCGSSSCSAAQSNRASLTISGSLLDANTASQQAGAISADRTILNIANSFVTGNTVTAASNAYGGGLMIFGSSAATVTATTIARNNAATIGGGISIGDGASLALSTSFVYSNTSNFGGGIYVGNDGSPTGILSNNVLADNTTHQIGEQACSGRPILEYRNNTITPRSGRTDIYASICNPPGIVTSISTFNTLNGASGNNTNVPVFANVMVAPSIGPSRVAWSIARASSVSVSGIGTFGNDTGSQAAAPNSPATYRVTASTPSGSRGPIDAVIMGPMPWGNIAFGDIAVPKDYDGDGKADVAIYRSATAEWFIVQSSNGVGLRIAWGASNFVDVPAPGDYDGDGRADLAVFRPSTGEWFVRKSTGGTTRTVWGSAAYGDQPVNADYDGDRKDDIAIFRRATGDWIILQSAGGVRSVNWGAPSLGDLPVAADYDGDRRAHVAVYRRATGEWFLLRSQLGGGSLRWGDPGSGDMPVPADYDGDGRADLAVAREWSGQWFVMGSNSATRIIGFGFGSTRVPADYDGDGTAELALWRSADGRWVREQ